jgi:transcriptional regulator with XRE-family HTH domain
MTKDGNDLVARLRSARERAGLSQGQTARLLGVHRPTISEIEAGRRAVKADELTRLADLYGVTISWLTGADSETPQHVLLAARKMSKLKEPDLERVLQLIETLSGS